MLQSYATAPLRTAPAPVAGAPDNAPLKLSPGEQGRSLGSRRASL